MSWSLKLGEVAGIRVQVHFTFLIFMAWIVLSGLIAGKSQQVVLANAAFMLGLFGCVVLHEFGHALTAKRYGIRTKDITLLPSAALRAWNGCLTTHGTNFGLRWPVRPSTL